jgi:branched-chain amino acid transport system substrate-binding protein
MQHSMSHSEEPAGNPDGEAGRDGPSRRQALKCIAGGGLAASMGLAGCVQERSDGGGGTTTGDDGDDGGDGDSDTTTGQDSPDIGTVTFGVLVPTSGASAPLGQAQRRGAELGVQFVNESDAFDFTIDPVYEDTQTDPATGRQRAETVVEENGAQYVVGALESSVALAVADYVGQQEAVYMSGAATIELTGSDCNANTFRYETNAAQQMAGLVDFAAEELGTNWWLHTTDDAYGNSAFAQIERRIDAQGLDVDIVGRTMPDKGTTNYGPQVSQISNSDAEVVALPETGADLVNFMKQASNAGLTEEVEIIGTALFAQVSRQALGETAVGTYSSTLYNAQLDTGDNQGFVEAYRSAHDGAPGSFARVGYELVRMAARGIQAAGTADPTQVRETLEGLEMTTVLGETSFRPCDHQSVNPVWTGEIVAGDPIPGIELLSKVEGPDAIRPCEETGCSL